VVREQFYNYFRSYNANRHFAMFNHCGAWVVPRRVAVCRSRAEEDGWGAKNAADAAKRTKRRKGKGTSKLLPFGGSTAFGQTNVGQERKCRNVGGRASLEI
jgi:hypothetical protein